MIPLVDPGGGGLYKGGSNRPPQSHIDKGVDLSRKMQRLNANGEPDPRGKLVLLEGPGMSNVKRKSNAHQTQIKTMGKGRKYFTPFNACEQGWDFLKLFHEWKTYEAWLQNKMAKASISPLQVQALWLTNTVRGQDGNYDKTVADARGYYEFTYEKVRKLFPNLCQVFVSSSGCSYYAVKPLPRHEPPAGWEGHAAKAFVEDHMDDDILVDWGPYMWGDGPNPRRYDSLVWLRHHFEKDGVHPTIAGAAVWGRALHDFFKTNPATAGWYRM